MSCAIIRTRRPRPEEARPKEDLLLRRLRPVERLERGPRAPGRKRGRRTWFGIRRGRRGKNGSRTPHKDNAAAGRYENYMDTSGCSEKVYSMVLPLNDGQLEQEDSQEAPADNIVGPAADGEATGTVARHGSGTTAEEGERFVTSQQHPAPGVPIQEAGKYTTSAPLRGQLITPTGEPILNPQLGTTLTSYLDNNVRLAIELAQERRALTDQMTSLQVGLETSMKEFEERMVMK